MNLHQDVKGENYGFTPRKVNGENYEFTPKNVTKIVGNKVKLISGFRQNL